MEYVESLRKVNDAVKKQSSRSRASDANFKLQITTVRLKVE